MGVGVNVPEPLVCVCLSQCVRAAMIIDQVCYVDSHPVSTTIIIICYTGCPKWHTIFVHLNRACERSGSGRISAHRSNQFLWLPIPAPFPAPPPPAPAPLPLQPTFFTPAHRSAPAHQIFGPLLSSSAPLLLQYILSSKLKSGGIFTARADMLARYYLS